MHVCFVCPGATGLFTKAGGGLGGTERQLGLLGRELARRGHRVTFVVRDAKGLNPGRLHVVPLRLRADLPRGIGKIVNVSRLCLGLESARPDLLVMRGADTLVLDLALYARARRLPFVFMAASDDDFRMTAFHTDRARNLLYRQGIRMADAIVAQTELQRTLAMEKFRRRAAVIPNPVEIPPEAPPPGDGVLWVGALRPYKRPEAVLALARALPEVRFTVVGGAPGDAEARAAEAFLRDAAALPNVTCAGDQKPERMDRFYARAAVVINTSPVEGFPNALLEGWARGRPAVTCGVDPDEVICRHELGIHARGLDAMAKALGALLGDPARRLRMGENARAYVKNNHAVGPVVDRLESLLAGLVRKTGGRSGRGA
jgi:glycosyltransferase involved in cell wall biosynthesis